MCQIKRIVPGHHLYESLGQRTFHQITIENLFLIQEEYLNTTQLKWSLVGDLANIRHFFWFLSECLHDFTCTLKRFWSILTLLYTILLHIMTFLKTKRRGSTPACTSWSHKALSSLSGKRGSPMGRLTRKAIQRRCNNSGLMLALRSLWPFRFKGNKGQVKKHV